MKNKQMIIDLINKAIKSKKIQLLINYIFLISSKIKNYIKKLIDAIKKILICGYDFLYKKTNAIFVCVSSFFIKEESISIEPKNSISLILRLRKSLTKWRFLSMILFILIILSPSRDGDSGKVLTSSHIARINIEGPIMKVTAAKEAKLRSIIDDKNIIGVIVSIDSPGGAVYPSETLYSIIKDISKNKPVFANIRSLGASGGYMVAIAAKKIFASRSSITASIGVYSQSLDATGLLEKVGVKFNITKSGKLKGSPMPFEKYTDEMAMNSREFIEKINQMFWGMVLENRKLSDEAISLYSDGRISLGSDALKYGLIDAIGYESDAVKAMKEEFNIPLNTEVHDVVFKEDHQYSIPLKIMSYVSDMFFVSHYNQNQPMLMINNYGQN
jgi:protease-4